jgi:hypothetical protein
MAELLTDITDTKVQEAVEKVVIFFQDKDEEKILHMLQNRGPMDVQLQNAMFPDLKESYNTILKRVSRAISEKEGTKLKDTLNTRFLYMIDKFSENPRFDSLKNKLIILLLEKYRKNLLDENLDMSLDDFDSLHSQIQREKTEKARRNTEQEETEQENEKTIERIGSLKLKVSNFEDLSLSELQRIKKSINNVSSTTATTHGTGQAIPSRAPTRNPSFEFEQQDAEINIGDAAFLIWNKKELYKNLLDILSQSKTEAAFIEAEEPEEAEEAAFIEGDVFKSNVDSIFYELNKYSIIQLKDMMRVLEKLDNNTINNVCKLFILHVISEKEIGSSGGRKNKKTQKKKTTKTQKKRKSKTAKKQKKRKSKTAKR